MKTQIPSLTHENLKGLGYRKHETIRRASLSNCATETAVISAILYGQFAVGGITQQ